MLLIDRIALYKVYMEALKRHPIPKEFGLKRCLAVTWVEAAGFFLTKLSQAPTIEAEPVRHGRWVVQDEGRTRFMCSECKAKNYDGSGRYCPNCGAKMDGDSHEA